MVSTHYIINIVSIKLTHSQKPISTILVSIHDTAM